MKKLETDVVIVAGGPAGLSAAVTVGEMGLSSILLEKARTTGGAANMGMGPLGINTTIQKEQFNDISVEYAFDLHMNYTHYNVDADLVQTYFSKSVGIPQICGELANFPTRGNFFMSRCKRKSRLPAGNLVSCK